MALVEKAELAVGDVVKFVHHIENGVGESLVVVDKELSGVKDVTVTLLDNDLKVLQGIPAKALKLVKGVDDGE